jgi:MGT family glycosyltransferase
VSRFLFVVPPFVGHVNPVVGVAAELLARGHEVAWAGPAEVVGPLVGGCGRVFDCASPPAADLQRPPTVSGFAALEFLWERVLVPLADAMMAGVAAATERFRPDVLVVDQQALAGAVVAHRTGLPWATVATTSAELVDPLAGLPKVEGWLRGLMMALQDRHQDPRTGADLRFSPHQVLVFSTADLVGADFVDAGPAADLPLRFVGPSTGARPAGPAFPWHLLDPRRSLVLTTLGTANAEAGGRFLSECVTALRERAHRVQAVVVDPTGTLPGTAPEQQEAVDVIVAARVPQLKLLERAAAVICHAGHNTVCEALANGLPLVLAPIRDDQPVIADQVVRAGAGVRLRFTRSVAPHIGRALDSVLGDPTYRTSAERLRESFRSAGGTPAAARHLELLAAPAAGRPAGSGPR